MEVSLKYIRKEDHSLLYPLQSASAQTGRGGIWSLGQNTTVVAINSIGLEALIDKQEIKELLLRRTKDIVTKQNQRQKNTRTT
jgi:hypothetical protein